jgi:hypothetical protein
MVWQPQHQASASGTWWQDDYILSLVAGCCSRTWWQERKSAQQQLTRIQSVNIAAAVTSFNIRNHHILAVGLTRRQSEQQEGWQGSAAGAIYCSHDCCRHLFITVLPYATHFSSASVTQALHSSCDLRTHSQMLGVGCTCRKSQQQEGRQGNGSSS